MRTFRQFCEAKMSETSYGSRPAVHVVFDRPGLGYSWQRPVMRLGTQDHVEQEGAFVGTVEIPVREAIVARAGDAGQDLRSFILGIAVKRQPEDLFDNPDAVVDFDQSDFIGLPSDIEPIPDSLVEALKNNFWQGVSHPEFKVVN